MCGLAGILTKRSAADIQPRLEAMRAALLHRGPDGSGIKLLPLPRGRSLGLAHTRLAILDTSPAGQQPMLDEPSGSWIVYNGEIYNHPQLRRELADQSFRSQTDTETLLKSWVRYGQHALARLRGMFAFAIYDAPRQQLCLVRDRLGIKPLYLCQPEPDTWVFASEIRALLASGLVARRLNEQAVESYLALGAVTAPWTLIDRVESLLPGHCCEFDLSAGQLSSIAQPYWQFEFNDASPLQSSMGPDQAELSELLQESCALRMLSDVPVGVFLSGGIDSSAVVAALAAVGYRPRTFSIAFAEADYDESQHARAVAARFQTDHTELVLRPQQVLEEMPTAIAAYDQPSIDGLNTYFISQAVRSQGIKVALSGLGGDELFAGYSYFRSAYWLENFHSWRIAPLLKLLTDRIPGDGASLIKLRDMLRMPGRLDRYLLARQAMLSDNRRAVLQRDGNGCVPLPPVLREHLTKATQPLDAINAHSLLESSLYMANMLLRDTDQMSMAHALEVRVPLLDHKLVEFMAHQPGLYKLKRGRRSRIKGLLVDALSLPLPETAVRRRKMGFVFPWESWLRGPLRAPVEAILQEDTLAEAASLKADGVRQVWKKFLHHKPAIRYADILALVNLLAWVKRHIHSSLSRPQRETIDAYIGP